jgi:hypothetical protein
VALSVNHKMGGRARDRSDGTETVLGGMGVSKIEPYLSITIACCDYLFHDSYFPVDWLK